MNFIKKESVILTAIFFMAFVFRLWAAFADNRPFLGDQVAYDQFAVSLWKYHEFASGQGHPTAYVTPLYPMFLAGIYAFFGYSHLWAKLIQALLGSGVCLLSYFIAKEAFGRYV